MKKTGSDLPGLLIRNHNFVLLWAAYGISAIGDHLSELGLLEELGAMESDRATRVQALITFGFFLPFVILGPVAGWWADRFSRKFTMIGSDLLRAVVMGSLIWTVSWLLRQGIGDYAVVVPLGITGALAAFFSPCRQALLPTLIRDDQLVRANAMINALGTIGTIISAVIGGIVVKTLGANWNYGLDAGTFVLSALLLSFITLRQSRPVQTEQEGLLRPVVAGFRYVFSHRRVLQLILLGTVFWASAGAVISMVPALVRDIFGGEIEQVGIYRGLLGVGLALGAVMMTLFGSAISIQLGALAGLLFGGFWVLVLDAALIFKTGHLIPALALIGIGGAGATLLVTIMTSIQRFVPNSRRGRVFGVSDMMTMGALVLATGVLGLPNIPHIDQYNPYLLVLVAALLIGGGVVAWGSYRRDSDFGPATWLVWMLNRFWAGYWFRARRVGHCTIPTSGPALVVANHAAGVDPLVLIAASPNRLPAFLVAEEHYRHPLFGWFMRLNKCIPINRENPGKSFLERTLAFLNDGGCLGIFPEGTYAAPGEGALEWKAGVGMLALRTNVPVIPAYIAGTVYTPSPFMALFKRHDARIVFGPPVDLREFAGRERERDAQRAATEKISNAIQALAPRVHAGAADAGVAGDVAQA